MSIVHCNVPSAFLCSIGFVRICKGRGETWMLPWRHCVLNFDLSVSAISVEQLEGGRFADLVYSFVHAWYRLEIPFSNCAKFTDVYTKLQSHVIFWGTHDQSRSIWLCRFYDVSRNYFINFCLFKFTCFRAGLVSCLAVRVRSGLLSL